MIRSKPKALPLVAAACLVSMVVAGCAEPEDPARVELRTRLKQADVLAEQDLGRMLNEVNRSVGDRVVRFTQDKVTGELTREQREVVLGMLTNQTGVYDEGLRTEGAATVRVFNAPGLSLHPEYSAARKLHVDVETFLPLRFEFAYEFPGMGDYAMDLQVAP